MAAPTFISICITERCFLNYGFQFVAETTVNPISRPWAIVLGLVFALIAVSLAIASWTRWGQNKPLSKCVALAVLAHVWLLMYAYGTRIIHPGYGDGYGEASEEMSIAFDATPQLPMLEQSSDSHEQNNEPEQLTAPEWATPLAEESIIDPLAEAASAPDTTPSEVMGEMRIQAPPELLRPTEEIVLPEQTSDQAKTLAEILADSPLAERAEAQLEAPQTTGVESSVDALVAIDRQHLPLESIDMGAATLVSNRQQAEMPGMPQIQPLSRPPTPEIYQMRLSPNRQQIAYQNGGDESSEAAVAAALSYLARVQQRDGSWSASSGGAGRETYTLGENRSGTGGKADTAMTGLALLAFLGAGHTHLDGDYRDTVTAGLEYLMTSQMHSGDLAGPRLIGNTGDVRYSRMYSHGMALLALAECYAITADNRLRTTVEKGCAYTLSAQNPRTGGWRYDVRLNDDAGDLSQFGWQALAVQSCRRGGIFVDSNVVSKMHNFLDSVSTGQYGGLARYRPVAGYEATVSMTAEALASKYLLSKQQTAASRQEAANFILQNLPGKSEENFYYFYYATIAMFQQQGRDWQQWNASMKPHLVGTQVVKGPHAGSWAPTCIWGGYGGRIYSTSFACMCLEVYYRYLPMYEYQ